MFWRLDLASCWRLTSVTKNACLAKTGAIFKSFSILPRSFCDCSLTLSIVLTQTLRVSIYKFHCYTCSTSNLQKTRYGLLFSHLISFILIFIFVNICVGVFDFCYGFVSVFLGLFLFGLCKKLFPFKFLFSC